MDDYKKISNIINKSAEDAQSIVNNIHTMDPAKTESKFRKEKDKYEKMLIQMMDFMNIHKEISKYYISKYGTDADDLTALSAIMGTDLKKDIEERKLVAKGIDEGKIRSFPKR